MSCAAADKRYVVYRDGRYPSFWIKGDTPDRIAEFLEARGFYLVDAEGLRVWMEDMMSTKRCLQGVVVMAQDAAPDTIYPEARADTLVRRFMDAGGRIVWAGDIPFYYRGRYEQDPMSLEATIPRWDQIGHEGQYAVLGSVSASVTAARSVRISSLGKIMGLRTKWTGERPVVRRYLRWWRVLATTRIRPRVHIDDIVPQRLASEGIPSSFASVASISQLVDSIRSLVGLTGLLLLLVLSLLSVLGLGPKGDTATWVAVGIGLLLLIPVGMWARDLWHRRCVSAWVAKFGRCGEFVRIWDYQNIQLNDEILTELWRVATHKR